MNVARHRLASGEHPLSQRIQDRHVAEQACHQHRSEAGHNHRHQHCRVGRHLGYQHNRGERSAHTCSEERGHADYGETFRFQVHIRESEYTE